MSSRASVASATTRDESKSRRAVQSTLMRVGGWLLALVLCCVSAVASAQPYTGQVPRVASPNTWARRNNNATCNDASTSTLSFNTFTFYTTSSANRTITATRTTGTGRFAIDIYQRPFTPDAGWMCVNWWGASNHTTGNSVSVTTSCGSGCYQNIGSPLVAVISGASAADVSVSVTGGSVVPVCDTTTGFDVTTRNAPGAGRSYTGTYTKTDEIGCADPTWTSSGVPSWISGFPASGRGTTSLSYTVDPNPSGTSRSATITIGSSTLTINQAGGCSYTLGSSSASPSAAGGSASVGLTATSGCAWTATSNDAWITGVTASGTGDGTINYTVAANTGPARSGTITIGGQTFTVNQDSGCSYALTSSSDSPTAAGGASSFGITTGTGCPWTATTGDAWLSGVTASGAGSGTINYTASANTGLQRVGTITVGSDTFTVTQASGCAVALTSPSTTTSAAGGMDSFGVTTDPACAWTTTTSDAWLGSITASGTGSSTVNFAVATNPGGARLGAIRVTATTTTQFEDHAVAQAGCPDSDSDNVCDIADVCSGNDASGDTDGDLTCNDLDLDDDGDGRSDAMDSAPLNPLACADTDADSCDDCSSGAFAPAADGLDTDGDGACDLGDGDDDQDGVLDGSDSAPLNANACRDADLDTCDDCVSGTVAPAADGQDTDADGRCDLGDSDDDNDGAPDGSDSQPLNALVCGDSDGDSCEDCTSGIRNTAADGTDSDADGQCDAGDLDDDDDGVPDGSDSQPLNRLFCSDTDGDSCEDCSSGAYNTAADGVDSDADGQCDAGDADDDNDGVPDGSDSHPLSPTRCSDNDSDTCDDCASGLFNPAADGTDTDADGQCDAGDSDDDGDGVPDASDSQPLVQTRCSDLDNDSCDDCTTGSFSLSVDGLDTDQDGACDLGDLDDDGDGVDDANDAAPLDATRCDDSDGDGCDDCSGRTFSPSADGTDTDSDGQCDTGDQDDDGDGVDDASDLDPLDEFTCRDSDNDGCDDCVSGSSAPAADGLDTDQDGLCDSGDLDRDGDGVEDANDSAPLDRNRCADSDADSCDDCSSGRVAVLADGLDTDADGLCDPGDSDDDGDRVPDANDAFPLDKLRCRDADSDGCDDCVSGRDDATKDGLDTDSDGLCNQGDADDDGDGVSDANDLEPLDRVRCADDDTDGCDDCSAGSYDVANDGDDNDGDGLCDLSDLDDDADGVPDAQDMAPLDQTACSDLDADGCDDCTSGRRDLANDGQDADQDGQCNLGDLDDDNDGVEDALDLAPLDPMRCTDSDGDSCDDCSTGSFSTVLDGADQDLDGACDLGDPDDDNDGVEDSLDRAPLNPLLCMDMDVDSCDDCAGGMVDARDDGLDTDADGLCDAGDPDDDGDGAVDSIDAFPLDPMRCGDSDGDSCEECATGTYSPASDGPDTDGDGQCDAGDDDDDNDGVADMLDRAPLDPLSCADRDADRCDDCARTGANRTGGDPRNDGVDSDDDGTCDIGETDIDDDGIPDPLDPDADGDGIPNDRDGRDDPDGDGVASWLDSDADGDGIPDSREASDQNGSLTYPDTDGDSKPDHLDVDADGDGIDDEIEAHDRNGDGASDVERLGDDDGDGLDDGFDEVGSPVDTDADGTPDYRDSDDDGDGLLTTSELSDAATFELDDAELDRDGHPNYIDADSDGDGVRDGDENTLGDLNKNQIPDYLEPTVQGRDSDDDSLLDFQERTPTGEDLDSDRDGIVNVLDTDDDGDGIPTREELTAGRTRLVNGAELPGYLDDDDDGDGIPTRLEIGAGNELLDTDVDGIADYLDTDSDDDGTPDAEEGDRDADGNGVPDYREPATFSVSGGGGSCHVATERAGGFDLAWLLVLLPLLVRRKRLALAALVLLTLTTRGASAQGVTLDPYVAPMRADDGIALSRPRSLQHRAWSAHGTIDYANDPLFLRRISGGARTTARLIEHEAVLHTRFAFGLYDHLTLMAGLDFVLAMNGESFRQSAGQRPIVAADGAGLADGRVGVRYEPTDESQSLFSLAIQGQLSFPLAEAASSSQHFSGERTVSFRPEILAELSPGRYRFNASLGALVRKDAHFFDTKLGDLFTYGLGGALDLPGKAEFVQLLMELYGSTTFAHAFTRAVSPLELLFGARAAVRNHWLVTVAGGPGLTRALGTPDYRLLVTFAFRAPPSSK